MMREVSITSEFRRQKTEITISERGAGYEDLNGCLVLDFKSLSNNDLASILNSLEKWVINNYKPELLRRWEEEQRANVILFNPLYEKIEEIVANIASIIKTRNQKVRMVFQMKEAEKTREELKTKIEKDSKGSHDTGSTLIMEDIKFQ